MKRNIKKMTLHDKAKCAMEEAVQKVVEQHKKLGLPLAVWKNGKVVYLSAKNLKEVPRKK